MEPQDYSGMDQEEGNTEEEEKEEEDQEPQIPEEEGGCTGNGCSLLRIVICKAIASFAKFSRHWQQA